MAIPAYTVNCLLKLTIYCSSRKRASNILIPITLLAVLELSSKECFVSLQMSVTWRLTRTPRVSYVDEALLAGGRLVERCSSFLVVRCGGSGP